MRLQDWFAKHPNVTRVSFAKRVGVSTVTVWRYETAQRFPRPEHLIRIADVTKGAVKPDDFVEHRKERT